MDIKPTPTNSFIGYHHHHHHHHQINYCESMEYGTPVLDLCTRKRPTSPQSDDNHNKLRRDSTESNSSTYKQSTSPSSTHSYDITDSSQCTDLCSSTSTKTKPTRPFKAFPKDPLSLSMGIPTETLLLSSDSTVAYSEFRKKMLSQVQATNNGTNKNMRRVTQPTNAQNSDPTYWEKRRKNNEAAKRSRDARRAKEDEIAIRCAFLEQENVKLKYEILSLKNETERLRNIVYPN